MWRWTAHLIDRPRDFFVKQSSVAKWPPPARLSDKKIETLCHMLNDIKRFFFRRCPPKKHYTSYNWQPNWEIVLIAIIDLLMYYSWGYFFVTAVKNLRRRYACSTFTVGLCLNTICSILYFQAGKFCCGGFLHFTFRNIFASCLTLRGSWASRILISCGLCF